MQKSRGEKGRAPTSPLNPEKDLATKTANWRSERKLNPIIEETNFADIDAATEGSRGLKPSTANPAELEKEAPRSSAEGAEGQTRREALTLHKDSLPTATEGIYQRRL